MIVQRDMTPLPPFAVAEWDPGERLCISEWRAALSQTTKRLAETRYWADVGQRHDNRRRASRMCKLSRAAIVAKGPTIATRVPSLGSNLQRRSGPDFGYHTSDETWRCGSSPRVLGDLLEAQTDTWGSSTK